MRKVQLILGVLGLLLLAAPPSAQAWKVTVTVYGQGAIDETTAADLLNCTTPTGRSESTPTTCTGGSSTGPYDHGWLVDLNAVVPQSYHAQGWRFLKWRDSTAAGWVNCDPQDTTGDQFTPQNCRFQIFGDRTVELYFQDIAGPTGTNISGAPTTLTKNTSATFNYGSDDPDAFYECRLDRPGVPGSFAPCGSGSTGYTNLNANGQYTFYVRAKDPSDNYSVTDSAHMDDRHRRTDEHDQRWPRPGLVHPISLRIVLRRLERGVQYNGLRDRRDCGVVRCAGDGLADGGHIYTARSTDAAGNVGTIASRSWTVDNDPPAATISGGPDDGSATPSRSASFTLGSDEAGLVECRLGTDPFEDCGAGAENFSNLADGSYVLEVRATDAAGNVSSTVTRGWTVDNVAPVASIVSGPAAGSTTSERSASFGLSTTEGALECRLDGEDYAACSSPKAYSGLADGAHTFTVRARDAAGNVSAAVSRGWTIAQPAPPGDGGTGGTGGGGTGGTGGPGAAPPPPTPTTPNQVAQLVAASSGVKFKTKGSTTTVTKFVFTGVTRGATVTITCRGKGCPRSIKPVTAGPNGKVDLTKTWKKRKLGVGAVLKVTVSAPGMTPRTWQWKTRKGKRPSGGPVTPR